MCSRLFFGGFVLKFWPIQSFFRCRLNLFFSNLTITWEKERKKSCFQKLKKTDNIYGVNFVMSFMALHWYIDSERDCGARHPLIYERKRIWQCSSFLVQHNTFIRGFVSKAILLFSFSQAISTVANEFLLSFLARSIRWNEFKWKQQWSVQK